MLCELAEAFATVKLEIGSLLWSRFHVAGEQSLTFVGTLIDLRGNDARAVQHRIAQATQALGRWQTFLRCRFVSAIRRARAVYKAVFPSGLWLV